MAKIEVTLSEMKGAANKIQKACGDFLTEAEQTMKYASALGSSWEGDSQVAFMTEQRHANDWYKKMGSLVESFVGNLKDASQLYENADEESASAIRAC